MNVGKYLQGVPAWSYNVLGSWSARNPPWVLNVLAQATSVASNILFRMGTSNASSLFDPPATYRHSCDRRHWWSGTGGHKGYGYCEIAYRNCTLLRQCSEHSHAACVFSWLVMNSRLSRNGIMAVCLRHVASLVKHRWQLHDRICLFSTCWTSHWKEHS